MLTPAEFDFAASARADNTRRAYRADLACFERWCGAHGLERPLPADPAVVARYLAEKAGELAVSSLARRLAALKSWHLDNDHPPPQSGELNRVWKGIRKTLGRPPVQKKALVLEDLVRVINALPRTLAGIRAKALLLMWFAGALRRSEIAPLALDGPGAGRVVFFQVPEGAEIFIRRSKGDQEGRGTVVAVPWTRSALCPVAATLAWLGAAGIQSGAVFRKIDRWGNVSPGALSPDGAASVVKRACAAAGLDPKLYSGHSMRRGFITTAARQGARIDELRRHARHADVKTTLGYIEAAGRFESSLAGRVGL